MPQPISLNSQNKYEIKIYGQLDDSWLVWFGEVKALVELVVDDCQVTTFSNIVMDQAGLVGLIRRLHGLGVVLISIVRSESDELTVSKDIPGPMTEQ